MSTLPKKPFFPFVTLDEIIAYDASKPETHTKSVFLNAVLDALNAVGLSNGKRIAAHMCLSPAYINHGVQLAAGLNLSTLRNIWTIKRVAELKAEHPDWLSDRLARYLGYDNRSVVWNIIHARRNAAYVRKIAPQLLEEHRNIRRPKFIPGAYDLGDYYKQ